MSNSFSADELQVFERLGRSALVRDASAMAIVVRSRAFGSAMRKVQVMRRRLNEIARMRSTPPPR